MYTSYIQPKLMINLSFRLRYLQQLHIVERLNRSETF